MTINFEEFDTILSHAKDGESRYFKPYSEPVLNSHHPDIKDEVFIVFPHGDEFKIVYPHRDDSPHETFSRDELARVFDEREWENFIPYSPQDDITQWLEHPIWGVYN